MKKLVGLSIIIMMFTLTISAQRQGQRQQKAQYTPEQRATIQSKKLALRLDLNEKQQKEVEKLMLKNAKEREKTRAAFQKNKQDGTGFTNNKRFERENMRLTKQQAQKAEFKKILTEDQFKKWENFNQKNMRQSAIKRAKSKGIRKGNGSKKQFNNRG